MVSAKLGDSVSISYIGTLEDGTIFHSTQDEGPLHATLGAGELFPALEKAILGMRPGETRNIVLGAEDAYGPRRPENMLQVARSAFPAGKDITPGQKLSIEFAGGATRVMVVTEATDSGVTLDGNHLLAGFNLTFALRLETVGVGGTSPQEKGES